MSFAPKSINRYITAVDEATGKSIFVPDVPSELPIRFMPVGTGIAPVYAMENLPVDIQGGKDLQTYQDFHASRAVYIENGTAATTVAMPPGTVRTSPMHRTMTVDMACIIEGELELELDSGEKRILKKGDVVVQREANHKWRNMSEDNWVVMFCVMVAAKPLEVAGKLLEEKYEGVSGNPLAKKNDA